MIKKICCIIFGYIMLCIPNCAMAMDFEMSKAKYYHTFNEVEIYYYLLSVKNERNGWKQYRIAVYEKNNDMPANSCTYIVSGLKKLTNLFYLQLIIMTILGMLDTRFHCKKLNG